MSMTPMRKVLFGILGVLVVVLLATRVHLPSHPRPSAPAPAPAQAAEAPAGPAATPAASGAAEMRMISVSAGGVYWVTQPQDGPASLLHAARAGHEGRVVATASDIRSLAPAGKDLLYLTDDKEPNSGQLWRVGPGGAAPQSLAQGLRAPHGLLAAEGQLFWTETRPSPAPGLACVPVLQPLSLVVRANSVGQGKSLLAVSESAEAHFTGKLLGVRNGQLYWLQLFGQQYSRPTTMVSRVPLGGGPAEQLVRAEGKQVAALARRAVYWTAPSEEMSPPLSGRTVRRASLSGGGARTLTDWMSADGSLFVIGQRPVYCDQQYLWRVPSRLGEARPVAKPKLDSGTVVDYGGALYGRAAEASDTRLRRIAMTPGGWLRRVLGP